MIKEKPSLNGYLTFIRQLKERHMLQPTLAAVALFLCVNLAATSLCFASTTDSTSNAPSPANQKERAQKLKVTVNGLSGETLKNVQQFLTLVQNKASAELTARKINQWFAKGKQEINAALQPFGYYQPSITANLVRQEGLWHAIFDVVTGPVTTVSKLSVQVTGPGKGLATLTEAIESFQPQRGATLNHAQYETSKETLLQALIEAGYLDATFEQARIAIWPEKNEANIEITLHTGNQYFFGPTSIKQSILAESFFSKYIIIPEGEPFNTQTIINQKLLLDDSQYFASVEPFPLKAQAVNYHIPIEIHTTPRKPRRYTLGMGYGTDTGPRVNAGIAFRRVNRIGHKVDTNALLSPITQNVNVRYRIPFKDVRTDEIAISSRGEIENIENNKSQRLVFGLERHEQWLGLRRKLYLETTLEDFETTTGDAFARIITPGVQLSFQKLDNALFPRRGVRFQADTRAASTQLHSTVNFQRLSLTGGGIWPLGQRSRLIIRGEAGWLETDNFADVPPIQRFYAGGARNVRGYGYRELGATDTEGSPVGGSEYLFGSIELDALLVGNFGLAVFYDIGAAHNPGNVDTLSSTSSAQDVLKPAAGLGFRWRSPVGMLRLDVATPLDEEEDQFQIHFSIGPDL